MTLTYSLKALIDMDLIAETIQKDSSRAALRFLEAAERTATNLLTFPEFGAAFESNDPKVQGLRVCTVFDFRKYLLFYRVDSDVIKIVRIIHGHRDLLTALEE